MGLAGGVFSPVWLGPAGPVLGWIGTYWLGWGLCSRGGLCRVSQPGGRQECLITQALAPIS